MKNPVLPHLAVGVLAAAMSLLVFVPELILSLDKPLSDHDDPTGLYLLFENGFTKLIHLDFENFFEGRLYYPLKHSIAFRNSFLGQSLLGFPVYLFTRDVITSANAVLLLDYFLSFLGAYLLAFRLTRSRSGAILAGVIYAYNSYMMVHQNFEQAVGQWTPLLFLLAEDLFVQARARSYILLGIVGFLQFTSSFYYTLFSAVTWPLYLYIRIKQKGVAFRSLWHPVLLPLLALAILFGQWYLRPYLEISRTYDVGRTLEANELFSANLSDFLFTSPNSFLYGGLNKHPFFKSLRDPYAALHPAEHSLFPGMITLFLLALAIFLFSKRKFDGEKSQHAFVWTVILAATFLLSLGPSISFGDIRLPGPYFLFYHLVPFAQTLRVPSRFVVISFLSLAMLAALAWEWIWTRRTHGRLVFFMAMVIALAAEYHHRFGNFFVVQPEIRKFYSWLDRQDSVNAIVELPIGNDLAVSEGVYRSSLADSQYMLYGVYHRKYMVNGNSSFIPPDVLKLGALLTLSFPTPSTVRLLCEQGVDVATVHREEFLDPAIGERLIRKIENYGLKRLYQSDTIEAFSLCDEKT